MPYSRWYNPAYYGDLVLGIGPGVGEAPEARSKMQQANLSQNYPNPFRAATKILYVTTDLGYVTPSHTSLQIYDIAGRLVRTLVHKKLQRGRYTVSWDGKDSGGTDVAAGIYFYQLRVGNLRITKKMSVVR